MNHEPLLEPFTFEGWGDHLLKPSLSAAETRARRYDEQAIYMEKQGQSELATEAREKAAAFRQLSGVPDEIAREQYHECITEVWDDIVILLSRAESSDEPLTILYFLLGRMLEGFHALAARGKKRAAELLMARLAEAVTNLEFLAEHKPELFRDFAEASFGIPGIISPSKEKTEDNERFVKELGVGATFPLAILPSGRTGKKWRFQGAANGLAARLQSYIHNSRTLYDIHRRRATDEGRSIPTWLDDAAKLEPFSPESWPSWAEIAWRVLADISPDNLPEKHPAFYDPKTKICNVRTVRQSRVPKKPKPIRRFTRSNDVSERFLNYLKALPENFEFPVYRSLSIRRYDLLEALFDAFELIATGKSRRDKQRNKAAKDN